MGYESSGKLQKMYKLKFDIYWNGVLIPDSQIFWYNSLNRDGSWPAEGGKKNNWLIEIKFKY